MSVLLYEVQTWTIAQKDLRKLRTVHMKCLCDASLVCVYVCVCVCVCCVCVCVCTCMLSLYTVSPLYNADTLWNLIHAMYLCMLHECMTVCRKEAVNMECGGYCAHLGEVRNRQLVEFVWGSTHASVPESQNRCTHTSTQHIHKRAQTHTHPLSSPDH